jgi:hypothetical protein
MRSLIKLSLVIDAINFFGGASLGLVGKRLSVGDIVMLPFQGGEPAYYRVVDTGVGKLGEVRIVILRYLEDEGIYLTVPEWMPLRML